MKNLLNPEGAFFQFLSRIGDMILLNVLFLLCSLPVITFGASLAALHKMLQEITYDTDSSIVKGFFRAFGANFKQATLYWIILLVIAVSLYCDFLLIVTYFSGTMAAKWMLILLAVLGIIIACVAAYMIPLMVRYENTLRQHLSNAIVLTIIKLPKTVAMVALNFLPVLLFLISPTAFMQTLIFWFIIGFAFVAFLESTMLKSVFEELERGNDSVKLGL